MSPSALACHQRGCDQRAAGSSSACVLHAGQSPARGSKVLVCVVCSAEKVVASTARAKTCSQACKGAQRQRQQKAWKVANAERVSQKGAERYDKRRDEILEYAAKTRAEKADQIRVAKRHYRRNRDARDRSTRKLVSQRDLNRAKSRYGGCAYCGDSKADCHWDHVLPLARGGTTSKGNLLPACPRCNMSKGAKTVMEWRVRMLRSSQLDLLSGCASMQR